MRYRSFFDEKIDGSGGRCARELGRSTSVVVLQVSDVREFVCKRKQQRAHREDGE